MSNFTNDVINNVCCRLCLKKEFKLRDIFKNQSYFRMAKKIKLCTDVNIKPDDGYSTMICSTCLKALNNAYKFRKKCQQSAHALKSFDETVCSELHEMVGGPTRRIKEAWSESDDECIQSIHNLKRKESIKELTIKAKIEDEFVNSEIEDSCSIDATESLKVYNSKDLQCKQEIEILENLDTYNNIVDQAELMFDRKKCKASKKLNGRKTKDKTEQCSECGKLYKSAGYLAHHMRIHNNGSSSEIDNGLIEQSKIPEGCQKYNSKYRPFTCSVCGKGFTQAGNLAVHHRSHTGERPFQCDICFKAFTQVGNLYVHKRVHADVREFKCDLCPMDFKLLSHLGEHMKTHSGVKEHQCMTCGKGFHKSSHLLTHMRTHTGEKPFSCEHCGRFFNDSSNLATHIRIHTGSRPFTCKHCNKGFAQKISMIRHEKQHTLVSKIKKNPRANPSADKKDVEKNIISDGMAKEFQNISDVSNEEMAKIQLDAICKSDIICKTDSVGPKIWHV